MTNINTLLSFLRETLHNMFWNDGDVQCIVQYLGNGMEDF